MTARLSSPLAATFLTPAMSMYGVLTLGLTTYIPCLLMRNWPSPCGPVEGLMMSKFYIRGLIALALPTSSGLRVFPPLILGSEEAPGMSREPMPLSSFEGNGRF